MELEFAVDPLFKKASADFDEGGAKGLLLNHLSIDSEGRIVFDSSDDTGNPTPTCEASDASQTEEEEKDSELSTPIKQRSERHHIADENVEIDIDALASKFFPDLSILDSQDICPSMKSFALGDPNSDLTIPFLKPPEDWRDANKEQPPILSAEIHLGDQTGIFLDGTNAAGFDDDDDDDDGGVLGGFDLPPHTGFGEGGEAWAKEAALGPMLRASQADDDGFASDGAQDGIAVGDFDPANPQGDAYGVSLHHREGNDQENILAYFDHALKSQRAGWAGHEHWRIRKIKLAAASAENPAPVRQRKEKEPFEIDFLSPMSQSASEMIYTMASSNSAISLPKAQWKTKGRNLLPDDRHFSSRSLLSLFLKPKARLGRRNNMPGLPGRDGGTRRVGEDKERFEEMDEAYWARRTEEEGANGEETRKAGDYDANFFADDDAGLPFVGGIPDDGDDDDGHGPAGFTDAREMLSPPPSSIETPGPTADSQAAQSRTEMLPGSFGSQLVTKGGTRLRPEYVNYARVAKKVDVRRLKENMWIGMSEHLMASIGGNELPDETHGPPTPAPTEPDEDGDVDMMDVDAPEEMAPKATARLNDKTLDNVPELRFTNMISDLRKVYPEQQMRDISTSYCFICLLHLANEKGLVLDGGREEGAMQEILVRKDVTVGEGYVGE
jgi:condensin complex subunit 2